MHQMIHEHLPVGEEPRSAEDWRAVEAQLPRFTPRRIALIEGFDQLLCRFKRQTCARRFSEIQLGRCQDRLTKTRKLGDVWGKLTQRHRFCVRLEVHFDGNAIQQCTRLLRLFVPGPDARPPARDRVDD